MIHQSERIQNSTCLIWNIRKTNCSSSSTIISGPLPISLNFGSSLLISHGFSVLVSTAVLKPGSVSSSAVAAMLWQSRLPNGAADGKANAGHGGAGSVGVLTVEAGYTGGGARAARAGGAFVAISAVQEALRTGAPAMCFERQASYTESHTKNWRETSWGGACCWGRQL